MCGVENQITERLVGKISYNREMELMIMLSLEGIGEPLTQYCRHDLISIFEPINLLGPSER